MVEPTLQDAGAAQRPERFDGGEAPRRIGVFRALVLGDLLCAVPALRALKASDSRNIVHLIGLPWARELVGRLGCVDGFVEFPGFPGLPERAPDLAALPQFFETMRSNAYDLLLQMHGSGSIVNHLMAACGARSVGGFVEPGGYCLNPALHCLWPTEGTEVERMLRLTDHLGLPRQGLALEFPITDEDRSKLFALWPGSARPAGYVCIHSGAQLPSRQWPLERFAAVGDALAAKGYLVVLTGSPAEVQRASDLAAAMHHPVVNLAGQTNLWTLGALIERARLLVSNDTGVSHIAAALRTRSVIISSGGDAARWAPADHRLHQVLWSAVPCRPCSHRACPYGHECALGIDANSVAALALNALNCAASSRC